MDGSKCQHDLGGQLEKFGRHSSRVREQAFRRDDLAADVCHLVHQTVAALQRTVSEFLDMIDAQARSTTSRPCCQSAARCTREKIVRAFSADTSLSHTRATGHLSVSAVRFRSPGCRAFQAAIKATCLAS